MSKDQSLTNPEEGRLGTASEFIDRAVAMLEWDEYKDDLVAGYNGIISLLRYAKSKIERMDSRIQELEGIKPLTDEEIKKLSDEVVPSFFDKDMWRRGYKACQEKILKQLKQRI